MNTTFEIFKTFLVLGFTAFGGPAAHLGFFRKRFVEELKWISDDELGQTIALSQFLPGPGSSQVGFAIGLHRGGLLGGMAAFLGFTLPAWLLMLCIAIIQSPHEDGTLGWWSSAIHGLKIMAVVVVANASWGMYQKFCQTNVHQVCALLSATALLLMPSLWMQLVVLSLAGTGGYYLSQRNESVNPIAGDQPKHTPISFGYLITFGVLFVLSLLTSNTGYHFWDLMANFYSSGSLVFGGGHVVLPLLQETVASSLDSNTFLTGYATVQAAPGPMFSFASYLGAALSPESAVLGSILATLAIFTPGFLLMLAIQPSWSAICKRPRFLEATASINAAVVGLLLSAMYQPVWVSAITSAPSVIVLFMVIYLLKLKQWSLPWVMLTTVFASFLVL